MKKDITGVVNMLVLLFCLARKRQLTPWPPISAIINLNCHWKDEFYHQESVTWWVKQKKKKEISHLYWRELLAFWS